MRWSIFFKDKITYRNNTNKTQNFLVHDMLIRYWMEFYEMSVKLFKNRIPNLWNVVVFHKWNIYSSYSIKQLWWIKVFLQSMELFLISACSRVWKQGYNLSRERSIWTQKKSNARDKRKTGQSWIKTYKKFSDFLKRTHF